MAFCGRRGESEREEVKVEKEQKSKAIDIKNKLTAAATHASNALLWPAHATSTSYLLPWDANLERVAEKREG